MLEYINWIVVPYVERMQHMLGEDQSALVIMDNFKGQITPVMFSCLEEHNIFPYLLPPNTTDRLQPISK